jgi:hypothetical protein
MVSRPPSPALPYKLRGGRVTRARAAEAGSNSPLPHGVYGGEAGRGGRYRAQFDRNRKRADLSTRVTSPPQFGGEAGREGLPADAAGFRSPSREPSVTPTSPRGFWGKVGEVYEPGEGTRGCSSIPVEASRSAGTPSPAPTHPPFPSLRRAWAPLVTGASPPGPARAYRAPRAPLRRIRVADRMVSATWRLAYLPKVRRRGYRRWPGRFFVRPAQRAAAFHAPPDGSPRRGATEACRAAGPAPYPPPCFLLPPICVSAAEHRHPLRAAV